MLNIGLEMMLGEPIFRDFCLNKEKSKREKKKREETKRRRFFYRIFQCAQAKFFKPFSVSIGLINNIDGRIRFIIIHERSGLSFDVKSWFERINNNDFFFIFNQGDDKWHLVQFLA